MKKTFFVISSICLLYLGIFSCTKKEEEKSPLPPTCIIESPLNGDIADVFQDLVIQGNAEDPDGEISEVILTVGEQTFTDIQELPFKVTLPAKELKEGNLDILLAVTDDGGNHAEAKSSITIKDLSQAPKCEITEPTHGAQLDIYKPFMIKGKGEAVSGEISKVLLSINGKEISDVKAVPFEYTVQAESFPIGEAIIILEIENTCGKSNKDMVSIQLADMNKAPECSISAPVKDAEFEMESDIIIKGNASDADGSIDQVVLKINDQQIQEITKVPFEYTLPKEMKKEGKNAIVLEVTDNHGKKALSESSFIILGKFREIVDARDQKTYRVVKIGEQVWFTENLAYLPSVNQSSETSKTEARYYVYDYQGNDVKAAKATDSYKNRGVLYNWIAAGGSEDSTPEIQKNIQGPCPAGWHVPSKAEWDTLYSYVRQRIPDSEGVLYWDGKTIVKNVSGHLRAKDFPKKNDPEFPQLKDGGYDTYGFHAQATGVVMANKFYYGPDTPRAKEVSFWLTHYDKVTYPNNPGGISTRLTNYSYEPDFSMGSDISRGFSVRCIKD